MFSNMREYDEVKDLVRSMFSNMREYDEVKDLAHFRKYNQNKLIIAHLKIISLRNKFAGLRN